MSSAQSVDAVGLSRKAAMSLFRHFALFLVLFSIFSFPALADFKCADGRDPTEYKNCTFGKCGVCPMADNGDAWASPKLEVIYRPNEYYGFIENSLTHTNSAVINSSECAWLAPLIRFCVRAARQAVPANGAVPAIDADPGNENSNKPRLCAYEDSLDAPDGNPDSSPYHKGSKNHIVIRPVGCVDRPIGPLPQMWKNSAWFDNSDFPPTFVEAANSLFESPKVQMQNCRQIAVGGAAVFSGPKTSCNNFDATTMVVEPVVVLNPSSTNNYIDCADADGTHIATSTSISSSTKVYCAFVSKMVPNKVQIRMIAPGDSAATNTADGNAGAFITALSRPGYIPKPTIEQDPASTATEPKIKVTLRGANITLEDDPGYYDSTPLTPQTSSVWPPNKICNYLHQVQFCIGRPCKVGQMVTTFDNGVYRQQCLEYEHKVCIQGYEKAAPYTVVNITNSTTLANNTADQPIGVSPNMSVLKDTNYLNAAATKENNAYLTEKFSKNIWVRKADMPAKCYKRSSDNSTSYCQNYNGTCEVGTPPNCSTYNIENASQAEDLWYINPETHQTRHMNAYESGLCLFTPPEVSERTYTYTGANQTYSVPTNCSEITVEVWGGGAKTRTGTGGVPEDYTGGAGGYATAVITVPAGTASYQYYVGKGGGNIGDGMTVQASGERSWFNSSGYLFGDGGVGVIVGGNYSNAGGAGGGTAPGRVAQSGESGATFHGNYGGIAGPKAWNGARQATGCGPGTTRASFGGGGCGADDTWWGIGGHGQIKVKCTKGMED